MNSTRQQIIDALEARLADIVLGDTVTVDGAAHTYSFTPAQVDTWRTMPYGDEELPAINIEDTDAETEGSAEIGRVEHALEIVINLMDAGAASTDAMRAKLLDIVKTVGATPTLGGLAHRILVTGHNLAADQASTKLSMGIVTITVLYRTKPYTL